MQIDSVETNAGSRICCAHHDRRFHFLPFLQVAIDVLDGDGGIVHQNADRERKPSERHQIDRLSERIEQDDRRNDRQRDGDGDDQCAAPGTEEKQNHQRREASGNDRFNHDATDGGSDENRLVPGRRDRSPLGQEFPYIGQLGPDGIDDA